MGKQPDGRLTCRHHLGAEPAARALFLASLVAGLACSGRGPTDPDIPETWLITWSPNMPTAMTGEPGGWYFDFPARDGVHYVQQLHPQDLSAAKSITMIYRIEASRDAQWVAEDGGTPPAVHLFVDCVGDDFTADAPNCRWWAAPIALAPGERSVSVALDSAQWTSLWGQHDDGAFRQTLAHVGSVGFTFGGSFYGHGVHLKSGIAQFHLISYSIDGARSNAASSGGGGGGAW